VRQLKISKSITNRESESLERYLKEIARIEMISAEEEIILARKIRAGDVAAFERLTNANLRFVVSVAKQYQNQGLTLSDLINEGNLGLIKAAWRFDETRGFKFISYAVWWIRQSIIQAMADNSRLVRVPSNKLSLNSKVSSARNKLEQEYEREPSADELAMFMDVSANEIYQLMSYNNRHVSLDAPVIEGEDLILSDTLQSKDSLGTDEEVNNKESLRTEVKRVLNILTLRQQEVVKYYFGLDGYVAMSLEDIADKFELTRERVRQIKDHALLKLKNISGRTQLRDFISQ
jgi:RNA polymerase primary sigma factor